MTNEPEAQKLFVTKLQERHEQLLQERQQNMQRIEVVRQQLARLEEAEIGYRYVIGEIERQLTEYAQAQPPSAPMEESDNETAMAPARVRSLAKRGGLRRRS